MKAIINKLNARYAMGSISFSTYCAEAKFSLRNLDWQQRLQYENMLLVTVY